MIKTIYTNRIRPGKLPGLILFFLFIALRCTSQVQADQHIRTFLENVSHSHKTTYAYQYQQNITTKRFMANDTLKEKEEVIFIVNQDKKWMKRKGNKNTILLFPDSSKQNYSEKDSIIYTGKEESWGKIFEPLSPGYNLTSEKIIFDRLDTLNEFYVLAYHLHTDSTTVFSSASVVTRFRKKDLLPVSYETLIQYQGMWQYERIDLKEVKKIEPDPKQVAFDKKIPIKKIVNCQEGRILADFSKFNGQSLSTKKILLVNGDSISLDKQKPKLLILDCFYAGCFPCRKAVPHLNQIYDEYKSKGVLVMGIDDVDKEQEWILKFIEVLKVNYPVSNQVAAISKQFPVTSYPTLLVFDGNLKFIKGLVGYNDQLKEELEALIEEQLKHD